MKHDYIILQGGEAGGALPLIRGDIGVLLYGMSFIRSSRGANGGRPFSGLSMYQ